MFLLCKMPFPITILLSQSYFELGNQTPLLSTLPPYFYLPSPSPNPSTMDPYLMPGHKPSLPPSVLPSLAFTVKSLQLCAAAVHGVTPCWKGIGSALYCCCMLGGCHPYTHGTHFRKGAFVHTHTYTRTATGKMSSTWSYPVGQRSVMKTRMSGMNHLTSVSYLSLGSFLFL